MSAIKQAESLSVTRIVTKPDESSALRVQRARLRVTRGPDRGSEIEVRHPGVVVGTGPECDLVLGDPAVSRRQFELQPADAGFVLRDLDSKNGTRIGRLEIGAVTLHSAETIEVGTSRIRFQALDSHDEFPLSERTRFERLLGRSVAMRQVIAVLERAAELDAILLIEGETGTGKDLAAQGVHARSARAEQPFVIVDCGAMQASLVESELFGHAKGAFTGALKERAGAFEAAEGGTVFLDEIGELDPALQPRLLRVLEQRQIKRLGENHHRPVDVRVIAATHRDLLKESAAGRFREDLFYRLSVLRLRMPALAERREDIGLLARSFVQQMQPDRDPTEVIHDEVLAMLRAHDWPGNVRELRNVVERLLVFPEQPAAALGPGAQEAAPDLTALPFHEARERVTAGFEREYLSAALEACEGVVARAAERAGIPRQTFHRLMSKHRLVRR